MFIGYVEPDYWDRDYIDGEGELIKSVNSASYYLTVGEAAAFSPMQCFAILPIRYSVNPNLPDGLSLNAETGIISGVPKHISTGFYEVYATDDENTAEFIFSLSIDKSRELVDLINVSELANSRIALQYRSR